jgi:hypothetical protein
VAAPERAPRAVALVEGGSVRIARNVDAATRQVVQAYTTAWQRVAGELKRAALDAAKAAGGDRNPAAYRTARLSRSLQAIGDQLRELGKVQGVNVSRLVPPVVSIPDEVNAALADARGLSWNLTPSGALRGIIARTTERITSNYEALTEHAQEQLRTSLVRGIAAGQGPRTVAAQLVADTERLDDPLAEAIVGEARSAFGGGLTRALVVTRTELLDASRYATTESYLANPGLVVGWRWLSALDRRTCGACWAMHNSFHEPDETLEGHPQCRCAQSPVLAGDDEIDPDTGRPLDDLGDPEEAFERLTRAEQLDVLGPKRLAAYEEGVPLRAMAARRDNPGWRASHQLTPLRDLPPPSARRLPDPPRPPAPAPAPAPAPVTGWQADVAAARSRLPTDRTQVGMAGYEEDLAAVEARVARIIAENGDDAYVGPAIRNELEWLRERVAAGAQKIDIQGSVTDARMGSVLRGHLEAVEDAGRVIGRELEDQLAARGLPSYDDLAVLKQQMDEALAVMEKNPHSLTSWAAANAARKSYEAAAELSAEARREIVLDLLSQLRSMGSRGLAPRYVTAADPELLEAMELATASYPTEWLEAAARRRDTYKLIASRRGFYSATRGEIALSYGRPFLGNDLTGVAVHELGHGMEDALVALRRLEWAHHYTRTTNPKTGKREPLRWLGRGYERNEKGRRDKYADKYAGKEYTQSPEAAMELFTMGVEALLGGRDAALTDRRLRDFVLGVLATL